MPKQEEIDSSLSLQDLRTIIHGLKMAGLSFIEEDAKEVINQKIAALPSTEQLLSITEKHDSLKMLTQQVGEIMRLIELYGKKDGEYKVRFKSKKGLPPRYKVLDWRKNMQEMDKAAAVKSFVKLSAAIDDKGQGELASKLIVCAKHISDGTINDKEIESVKLSMLNAGFNKEAGIFDTFKGIGNMGKGVADWAKGVGQSGKEMFQIGKYKSVLEDINNRINKIIPDVQKAYTGAKDSKRAAQLNSIYTKLSNMAIVGKEVYNLIMSEEQVAEPAATQPAQAPQTQQPTQTPPAVQPQTNAVDLTGVDEAVLNAEVKRRQALKQANPNMPPKVKPTLNRNGPKIPLSSANSSKITS